MLLCSSKLRPTHFVKVLNYPGFDAILLNVVCNNVIVNRDVLRNSVGFQRVLKAHNNYNKNTVTVRRKGLKVHEIRGRPADRPIFVKDTTISLEQPCDNDVFSRINAHVLIAG